MKSYKLLYLFWLIPGFLLFLTVHQATVFYSVVDTYNNGQSYMADVVDYNLKKIGAQNSAYVILTFQTQNGENHRQKLALPFEMIHTVSESNVVPVRYKKSDFVDIVIISAYNTQKGLALMNLGIAFLGFLIMIVLAYFVHRYVRRKIRNNQPEIVIERVDDEQANK